MSEWFSSAWTIALVALGIGGVIFIHECGHFVAARWCGVRVEVFSLGFGPRLLGWRRGRTVYQLALLPLGGYVKMAGEEGSPGAAPAPDELPAKSVGQRFFIYSGGVIANVLLGLVVFPLLFAHGVPFPEPLVGVPAPGSPAWRAGIEPGTRIVAVNGNPVASFSHITTEIALGSPELARLDLLDARGAEREASLVPRYDEQLGAYSIGVTRGADPTGKISVTTDSAAARAGLRTGDRLLAVEGSVPGLSLEEQLAMAFDGGGPVRARFERDGRVFDAEIEPEEPPASAGPGTALLGVYPLLARVEALRQDPLLERLGLAEGDRIVSVAGRPLARPFDLVRLLLHAGPRAELVFEHAGETRSGTLEGLDGASVARVVRDLGLKADTQHTWVGVLPGSAAERAGLLDGDRIVRVDGATVDQYADVQKLLAKHKAGDTLALLVERRDARGPRFVELAPTIEVWRPKLPGFELQPAEYVYRVSGTLAAMRQGWVQSWKFIQEGWLTLKRILNRQVSSENIGGIITIGVVSHHFAETGIVSLLFFLCMLSMNLAFLNVLPIPVLDGGHLLFLLIEKVKGSPVSERVMGYSQMVGIVLILSLMVYVTFNDVMRWIVHR